jgi:hypothetical protein
MRVYKLCDCNKIISCEDFRFICPLNYLISFFSFPAQTHVNNADAETPLKFISSNPRELLFTPDNNKNSPIYLDCEVAVQVKDDIRNDLLYEKKFYEKISKDDEEEEEEDELHYNSDIVKQQYAEQAYRYNKVNLNKTTQMKENRHDLRAAQPTKNVKNKRNDIKTNDDDDDDEDEDEDNFEVPQVHQRKLRSKRETRDLITYEWLKDDNSIISFAPSITLNSQSVMRNEFTLFANGTLKFQASRLTMGVYRCKAKFTEKNAKSAREFDLGPIISHATAVSAGKFALPFCSLC